MTEEEQEEWIQHLLSSRDIIVGKEREEEGEEGEKEESDFVASSG